MTVCPRCGAHICSKCGGELANRNYAIGICTACQEKSKIEDEEKQARVKGACEVLNGGKKD